MQSTIATDNFNFLAQKLPLLQLSVQACSQAIQAKAASINSLFARHHCLHYHRMR